jgi:phage terminase large subunit-like protein
MTNEVARDPKKVAGGWIGLVARTWTDARWTTVEGPSGVLATAPSTCRPEWHPGSGTLRWPVGQGVWGRIFAAEAPETLRGPNLSWVWADEVEHWPDNETLWFEVIELALRLGWARAMLTSTPLKGSRLLRRVEDMPDTVLTRAGTKDNPHLPPEVRARYYELYAGTRIGRQELDGEILEDVTGALWTLGMIQRAKLPPDLVRVVVAVDPAVTDGTDPDHDATAEHGIVVVGLDAAGKGYLLEDRSFHGSVGAMADRAVALYRRFHADAIVAEVNNGGDLVELAINSVDDSVKVIKVRASRGKFVRAEPVSALYERKRVFHVGQFPELEDQLISRVPGDTKGFDRFDAHVWGLTELMLQGDGVGPLGAYR